MVIDLSIPGLYCVLNTNEIQEDIKDLGERAVFKATDAETVAKMMADSFSAELKTIFLEKLTEAEKNKSKIDGNWMYQTLKGISASDFSEVLRRVTLANNPTEKALLTEVKTTAGASELRRPTIQLNESDLIVPNGRSPQLGNEIEMELQSCEHADWLVSFIKLKAIKAFYPALQNFCNKRNEDGSPRLRIATTTYCGATDVEALRLLLKLPNTQLKVCFDTSQTRLHAKAYIFKRESQFGSAYIGSANLSSAALSSGLEWTLKIAQQEIPHLWQRSIVEFDQCWNSSSFESCTADDLPRIQAALGRSRISYVVSERPNKTNGRVIEFAIHPHTYQKSMLEALRAERNAGQHRHLVVSATGTGKTIVAAFDFANETKEKKGYPTLLFLAHRKDIVEQAMEKYRAVLQAPAFGAVLNETGSYNSSQASQCFCTVQSWKTKVKNQYPSDFFDLIVLDECHHSAANTYQEIISWYQKSIDEGRTDLLGLTATPFRADGHDIRGDFGGSFTHELPLSEAIENGNIVPFTYFGIDDDVDYSSIDWSKSEGKQIEDIIKNNGKHLENVRKSIHEYIGSDLDVVKSSMRAIGFCAGLKHANAACSYMNEHGIPSVVLSGESTEDEREKAKAGLSCIPPKVNIIFTADLFNEGVDIPAVNTALMMRPTNSPLIFLQQLGRGLRIAPPQYEKNDLLVLDFVGNHNSKYRGFFRYQSLSTRKDIPLKEQLEGGMPFVPAGCAITLTQKSRERILKNINEQMRNLKGNALKNHLRQLIQDAGKHLPLTRLMDEISSDSPAPIYRCTIPSAIEAEVFNVSGPVEKMGERLNVLAQNDSPSLVDRWISLLHGSADGMSAEDVRMARFFLLSSLEPKVRISSVENIWRSLIQSDPGFSRDLLEFLDWRKNYLKPSSIKTFAETTKFIELHRHYNSMQIMAALGTEGAVCMSGTYYQRARNTDVFFITRIKGEHEFSATTMYDDYAKSPSVFHWESPGRTRRRSTEGIRYCDTFGKKMLFLRHKKKAKMDITGEYETGGCSESYVFLGPVKRVLNHEGECPIQFDFEMEHSMPASIFEYARGA